MRVGGLPNVGGLADPPRAGVLRRGGCWGLCRGCLGGGVHFLAYAVVWMFLARAPGGRSGGDFRSGVGGFARV